MVLAESISQEVEFDLCKLVSKKKQTKKIN